MHEVPNPKDQQIDEHLAESKYIVIYRHISRSEMFRAREHIHIMSQNLHLSYVYRHSTNDFQPEIESISRYELN